MPALRAITRKYITLIEINGTFGGKKHLKKEQALVCPTRSTGYTIYSMTRLPSALNSQLSAYATSQR